MCFGVKCETLMRRLEWSRSSVLSCRAELTEVRQSKCLLGLWVQWVVFVRVHSPKRPESTGKQTWNLRGSIILCWYLHLYRLSPKGSGPGQVPSWFWAFPEDWSPWWSWGGFEDLENNCQRQKMSLWQVAFSTKTSRFLLNVTSIHLVMWSKHIFRCVRCL